MAASNISLKASFLSRPVIVSVRYGHTPVLAERPWRYLYARRGLPPLVLAQVDHAGDLFYQLPFKAQRDYLLYRFVVFDIGLQHLIEYIIRRQGVLVGLVGAKLGSGGLCENALGDKSFSGPAVYLPADRVHERLRHIFYHGKAACHVAVEGRVADAHLALVAGRKDEPAELVAQGHEDISSYPRLHVLFGFIGPRALERPLHHFKVLGEGILYG